MLNECDNFIHTVKSADAESIKIVFDNVCDINATVCSDALLRLLVYHLPSHFLEGTAAIDLMRHMIGRGAELNTASALGMTALTLTISRGFSSGARLLIESGADLNLVGAQGDLPLTCAYRYPVQQKSCEMVCLLLDHGVDLDAYQAAHDRSLLSACVSAANTDLLRQLLLRGHDPRIVEHRVGNALSLAIFENATTTSSPGSKRRRNLDACEAILTVWFDVQAAKDAIESVTSLIHVAKRARNG